MAPRDKYFVVCPGNQLRTFADIMGISPTQIRHVTHPRHLAGLREVVVFLWTGYKETLLKNPSLIGELRLMTRAGYITLSPDIFDPNFEKET